MPGRDNHKRTPRDRPRTARGLDQRRKEIQAWEMRTHGVPFGVIAQTPWNGPAAHQGEHGPCMYGDRQAAYNAVRRCQEDLDMQEPTPQVEEIRTELRQRTDVLYYETSRILRRTHPVLDRQGRIVKDENGRPLDDDMVKLAAIREMRQLQAEMAKIGGAYAATKYEVAGPDGGAIPIESRIADLTKRIEKFRVIDGGSRNLDTPPASLAQSTDPPQAGTG